MMVAGATLVRQREEPIVSAQQKRKGCGRNDENMHIVPIPM